MLHQFSPVQMLPLASSNATWFESNALLVSYVCLSVLLGIKIGLQWFVSPYQAFCQKHLHPPSPLPHPLGHFATLLLARSMLVRLWLGLTLLHKLTLKVHWLVACTTWE